MPPDPDRRWRHPYLRVSLLLRMVLHTRWDAETWPVVRAEFTKYQLSGVPNKASAEIQAFDRDFLTGPTYRESLKRRIFAGKAVPIELVLHWYAWGRPKSFKPDEEGESRPPVQIIFLGEHGDPLSEDELPARYRPAMPPPPSPTIEEVPFEMDDIDLPPHAGS